MRRDLLQLPEKLADLATVAPEYQSLYEWDGDGWVLTQTAAGDFAQIKDAVLELAQQRDKANAALLEAAVMSAVMMAGVSGVMASAASCLYLSEHAITWARGVPAVITDLGNVDIKEAIAEWISTGGGQIFLPRHKAEKTEDDFWRQLVRRTK
jgi:hypothetical protein